MISSILVYQTSQILLSFLEFIYVFFLFSGKPNELMFFRDIHRTNSIKTYVQISKLGIENDFSSYLIDSEFSSTSNFVNINWIWLMDDVHNFCTSRDIYCPSFLRVSAIEKVHRGRWWWFNGRAKHYFHVCCLQQCTSSVYTTSKNNLICPNFSSGSLYAHSEL